MSQIPTPPPSSGVKGSPMGGWLVIFIAMYVISAAQGLLGLWPGFMAAFEMPRLAGAFLSIIAVIALWNLFILYSVILLILQKPNAVKMTKLMLISGPVVALLTPLLGAIAMTSAIPDAPLTLDLAMRAYTPEVMGQVTGMVILSLIWHRYFTVSKRVKAIWGEWM